MATKQEKETLRLAMRKTRLAASLKENLKRRRSSIKSNYDQSLISPDKPVHPDKNEG